MSVAYQSLDMGMDIGRGSNVYKIGSKGPACSNEGSNCRQQQQNDPKLWNLLTFSMYIRSQSPDSNPTLSSLCHPLRTDTLSLPSTPSTVSLDTSSCIGDVDRTRGIPVAVEELGLSTCPLSEGRNIGYVSDVLGSSLISCCDESGLRSFWDPSSKSTLLVGENEGPELSSSSSSIGEQELDSASADDTQDNSEEMEVQSSLRSPLDRMSALESSLPIKRGLSRYFGGKSRSFTSLAEVSSVSSVTELAKPENPYAKKRKGFHILGSSGHDRHRAFPPLSRSPATGISKKSSYGPRSHLAVALAMESKQEEEANVARKDLTGARYNISVPPRSYSLSDLHGVNTRAPGRA